MPNRFFLDPAYAYTPPSELKPDTLGAINFTSAIVALILFALPCFAAFLMSSTLVKDITTDRAYLAEGREVLVTVVSCERVSGVRSSSTQTTYTYTVDGHTFEGSNIIAILGARCEEYPAGTTFEALYLPSNPAESRVIQANVSHAAWYMIMVDALLALTGLVCAYVSLAMIWLLISGVRGLFHYHTLKRKNIVIDGELIEVKEEKVGRNKTEHNLNVTYRFQTPDGRILTRKQSKIRNDLRSAKPPPIGSPVSVLYADDNAFVML